MLTAIVENVLDVTNIQNILDSGDIQCEGVSQCFHHSHLLDHCDSSGDHLDHCQTTNDHLHNHHCTRASHLSDESILVMLILPVTNTSLGHWHFYRKYWECWEMWVIFQVYEKICCNCQRHYLLKEGCLELASFLVLGPHPNPASARWLLSRDKFYLSALFQIILWGKERSCVFFCFHSKKMVKVFIGNLPDGGLVSWRNSLIIIYWLYSIQVGNDDVRPLFEAFGTVTECEVIKNYGSVYFQCFHSFGINSIIKLYKWIN